MNDKIMELFEIFLKSDRKEARKYVYYGNIRYLEKNFKAAIINYTKAIELDYFNGGIHYNIALTKEKLYDYKGAIKHYVISLQLSSKDEIYYMKLENRIKFLKKISCS